MGVGDFFRQSNVPVGHRNVRGVVWGSNVHAVWGCHKFPMEKYNVALKVGEGGVVKTAAKGIVETRLVHCDLTYVGGREGLRVETGRS